MLFNHNLAKSELFPISVVNYRGTANPKVCYESISRDDTAKHKVSLEAAWVVTFSKTYWDWLTGQVTSVNQPFCCTHVRIPILLP
jgi:hypothetical protein